MGGLTDTNIGLGYGVELGIPGYVDVWVRLPVTELEATALLDTVLLCVGSPVGGGVVEVVPERLVACVGLKEA